MTKTIEEILTPKPVARPRIYAYAIDYVAHAGLLKVSQTTRDVKQRVAEQVKTAAIKNYRVFNSEQMNQAVFAFRRYEDASLRYTGIDSHPGLTYYGPYSAGRFARQREMRFAYRKELRCAHSLNDV